MPPTIPDRIICESPEQFAEELSALQDALSLPENEETWDKIERAFTRFSAVIKGGGSKYDKEIVNSIKAWSRPIVSALNSERTRLSASALDCLTVIAPRIGLAFEALVPLFVPHILHLANRSNKVYVTRAQASLALVLGYCHIPSIIPCLVMACKESKVATGRTIAVEGILRCLNKWDWAQKDIKAKVGDVEEIIKLTGRDRDAVIRQTSRKVFEAYKTLFPERIDQFIAPLTPVTRKYLDIKSQPTAPNPPMRRATSKPNFSSSTSALPSSSSTHSRKALGLHARSGSTNALKEGVTSREASALPTASSAMPPPALVPPRSRNASRPDSRPRFDGSDQEQRNDHERERVLSTASSTFSVKSAPSNTRNEYEHRPPVRLATSQSRMAGVKPPVPTFSGPPRRVRRVVAVEPHPANRLDILALAHKAPVRPTVRIQNADSKLERENGKHTQSDPATATGISFPSVEAAAAAVPPLAERKGAQRVPKPLPLPSVPAPSKADKPLTTLSGSKREPKVSIFRRKVLGPSSDDKDNKKLKEPFAPRRGGGVTQPTLSQLNKQKPPASSSGSTLAGKSRAGVATAMKRVGGAPDKPSIINELPVSRSESCASQSKRPATPVGEQVNNQAIKTPAGPVLSSNDEVSEAQLVPLPPSPETQSSAEPRRVPAPSDEEAVTSSEIIRDAPEPEIDTPVDQTENAEKMVEEPKIIMQGIAQDMIITTPGTYTSHSSNEGRMTIKTPQKVMGGVIDELFAVRSPLGEVLLNG